MFSLSDYDFELPAELIAQTPAAQRDQSRLLRLERATGRLSHHCFDEIGDLLAAGDLLVANDTAVVPARLPGRKESGGKVEVLLLDYAGGERLGGRFSCECLIKSSKPARVGSRLIFDGGLIGRVAQKPALACLSSRFPHGTPIDAARLKQVGDAEHALILLGFRRVRVRFHGELARVELDADEMARMLDPAVRDAVVQGVTKAGFTHVTLDLAGYRMGGANRANARLPLLS